MSRVYICWFGSQDNNTVFDSNNKLISWGDSYRFKLALHQCDLLATVYRCCPHKDEYMEKEAKEPEGIF